MCFSKPALSQEPPEEPAGQEGGGNHEGTPIDTYGGAGKVDYWHTHSNLKKCHIKIEADGTGTILGFDRDQRKWVKESDLDAAGYVRIQGRVCYVYQVREVGAKEFYAFSSTPVRRDGRLKYYAMYYKKNDGLWQRIRTPSWTEGIPAD
jgi:hypothetical protein